MKKNILNYEALLISLASKGDCTAFYSLIIPHFINIYKKMIGDGIERSEASKKLHLEATDLFKKFLGTFPENFNAWLKTHLNITEDSENDFLQSEKNDTDIVTFSNDIRIHLQRVSCALHDKKKQVEKNYFIHSLFGRILIVCLIFAVIIAIAFSIFNFSGYSFSIKIANHKTGPLFFTESEKAPGNSATIARTDSVALAQAIDSIAKLKIKIDSLESSKAHSASKKANSYRNSNKTSDAQSANSPKSTDGSTASSNTEPGSTGSAIPQVPSSQAEHPVNEINNR